MNIPARYLLGLGRAAVLVTALIVATITAGQDAAPVEGGQTAQIFLSTSNVEPVWAEFIVLRSGGTSAEVTDYGYVGVEVYVWVVDVNDLSGASAYNLELYFDGTDFAMTSFEGDPTWLSSNGRAGACSPPATIESLSPDPGDHAYLGCVTIGAAPPFGPTGDGLLAKMVLQPKGELGQATTLDLSASDNGGNFLLNTPANPNDCFPIQPECFIPATLLNSTVVFIKCADNNGDGVTDLANDILGVILRYQMTDSDSGWDPGYDLDDNAIIDLSNDILGTILQYQRPC